MFNIFVKNYKCFRKKTVFKFNQINIVLGANGTGKSAMLSVISLLKESCIASHFTYLDPISLPFLRCTFQELCHDSTQPLQIGFQITNPHRTSHLSVPVEGTDKRPYPWIVLTYTQEGDRGKLVGIDLTIQNFSCSFPAFEETESTVFLDISPNSLLSFIEFQIKYGYIDEHLDQYLKALSLMDNLFTLEETSTDNVVDFTTNIHSHNEQKVIRRIFERNTLLSTRVGIWGYLNVNSDRGLDCVLDNFFLSTESVEMKWDWEQVRTLSLELEESSKKLDYMVNLFNEENFIALWGFLLGELLEEEREIISHSFYGLKDKETKFLWEIGRPLYIISYYAHMLHQEIAQSFAELTFLLQPLTRLGNESKKEYIQAFSSNIRDNISADFSSNPRENWLNLVYKENYESKINNAFDTLQIPLQLSVEESDSHLIPIFETPEGKRLSFSQLNSGTKNILPILTSIIHSTNYLLTDHFVPDIHFLILEEPESQLHPKLQKSLLEYLLAHFPWTEKSSFQYESNRLEKNIHLDLFWLIREKIPNKESAIYYNVVFHLFYKLFREIRLKANTLEELRDYTFPQEYFEAVEQKAHEIYRKDLEMMPKIPASFHMDVQAIINTYINSFIEYIKEREQVQSQQIEPEKNNIIILETHSILLVRALQKKCQRDPKLTKSVSILITERLGECSTCRNDSFVEGGFLDGGWPKDFLPLDEFLPLDII